MNTNTEIFNYLHDTGVSNFTFDFQNKTVNIDFLLWDDLEQKEVKQSLFFYGVSKFISNYDQNIDFDVIGCYNAECIQINENKYQVTFLFDFLKQSVAWKVELIFAKFETSGALSKKALEYKYQECI